MSTTTHLSYTQFKVRTVTARVIVITGILWTLAASFDAAQGHYLTTLIGLSIMTLGFALKWHSAEHLDYRFKD